MWGRDFLWWPFYFSVFSCSWVFVRTTGWPHRAATVWRVSRRRCVRIVGHVKRSGNGYHAIAYPHQGFSISFTGSTASPPPSSRPKSRRQSSMRPTRTTSALSSGSYRWPSTDNPSHPPTPQFFQDTKRISFFVCKSFSCCNPAPGVIGLQSGNRWRCLSLWGFFEKFQFIVLPEPLSGDPTQSWESRSLLQTGLHVVVFYQDPPPLKGHETRRGEIYYRKCWKTTFFVFLRRPGVNVWMCLPKQNKGFALKKWNVPLPTSFSSSLQL